jgi:hypothetical protein
MTNDFERIETNLETTRKFLAHLAEVGVLVNTKLAEIAIAQKQTDALFAEGEKRMNSLMLEAKRYLVRRRRRITRSAR